MKFIVYKSYNIKTTIVSVQNTIIFICGCEYQYKVTTLILIGTNNLGKVNINME